MTGREPGGKLSEQCSESLSAGLLGAEEDVGSLHSLLKDEYKCQQKYCTSHQRQETTEKAPERATADGDEPQSVFGNEQEKRSPCGRHGYWRRQKTFPSLSSMGRFYLDQSSSQMCLKDLRYHFFISPNTAGALHYMAKTGRKNPT